MFEKICSIGVVNGGVANSMAWHNARHAIDAWNEARATTAAGVTLELVNAADTYATIANRVCEVAQRRIVGLFVAADETMSGEQLALTFALCNRLHLPCLTTDDLMLRRLSMSAVSELATR